jgi:hypothetical protein
MEVEVKRILLSLMAAALVFTASCTSTEEDVCDAKCECEGCSDREYDDCVFDYEDDERAADNRDCLDLYDEFIACRDDTGYCDGGREFETSCGREKDRFKACVD